MFTSEFGDYLHNIYEKTIGYQPPPRSTVCLDAKSQNCCMRDQETFDGRILLVIRGQERENTLMRPDEAEQRSYDVFEKSSSIVVYSGRVTE